jgi:hypothetical protein
MPLTVWDEEGQISFFYQNLDKTNTRRRNEMQNHHSLS